MLAELVAFPTVSRDSNLALIEYVQAYLEAHGVEVTLLPSPCGRKANLHATIGPPVAGGIVLSGHTDVVPVDGQDWHTDPFVLTERDGRLYGRGTCDMKAFSAIALARVPQMHALERPIHLALSYDEEIGCLGAPALIEHIARHWPEAAAVVVGEPTELKVVTAHKGIVYFETVVHGFEAHSSLQHIGVSAVMAAADLVHWLGELQRRLENESQQPSAADAPPVDHGGFEPAYTTVHCGTIAGGTAQNITARECRFVTDIRALPGDDPEQLLAAYRDYAQQVVLPRMQAVHADCRIDIHVHSNVPAFAASPQCPAVALAKQLTGQNESYAQPYGAEAGQFQQAGFATVMCGPGSIEQAHQPNEFISLAQFEAGIAFMDRLIELQSR
ncbi:MAG: acetylornithine deacetylase [Pseudomonadota bacterium]